MYNTMYLLLLLMSFESFADTLSGGGPPPSTMKTFGDLYYGSSTIDLLGQDVNCNFNESQFILESQQTSKRLALNAWVISSSGSGGSSPPGPKRFSQSIGGTSGTGVITKKIQISAILSPESLSKMKIFTENNEVLLFIGDSGEFEAPIVDFYSEPGQLEFMLENAVIKFMPMIESDSGGGGTPTITDAEIFLYGSIGSTGGSGGGPPMAMVDDGSAGGSSIAKLCDLFARGGSTAGGGTIGDKGGISGGRGVLLEDEEGGSPAVEGGLN